MKKTLSELVEMFKQNGFDLQQTEDILQYTIDKIVNDEQNVLINELYIHKEYGLSGTIEAAKALTLYKKEYYNEKLNSEITREKIKI